MAFREDENQSSRYQKQAFASFLLYAVLAFLYIFIGGSVLLFPKYWSDFPTAAKLAFGFLCIAYGCFRLYRAYDAYRQKMAEAE